MEPAFWYERWEKNQIGFHQQEINTHLQSFWGEVHVRAGGRIFVPLCGKSRDMLWLLGQGYEVVGVEISPLAVEAFFQENALEAEVFESAEHRVWRCDRLTLYQGDYFTLNREQLGPVDAVYDRASLIALPESLRQRYVSHLQALIPADVPIFLVTLEYPQKQMSGPPFSVAADEVETLFARDFRITARHSLDVLAENPRFRERGVTQMDERVYLLKGGASKK